jgi:FkbM family methyltransferase
MNLHYLSQPLRNLRAVARYVRIFGLKGIGYSLYCFLSKNPKRVAVSPRWSPHPLHVRLNTSDISVFRQVFLEREYNIVSALGEELSVIVDGGANIGLTSVALAQLYPDARILAVEPEAQNLKLLRDNTAAYARITVIPGALWDTDEPLTISDSQNGSWAFQVRPGGASNTEHNVKGYRISSLAARYGISRVSLLKLDIEGAEYEVLGDYAAWEGLVDHIVIELHERIRPGCDLRFKQATRSFEVVATTKELVMATRSIARRPDKTFPRAV